MLATQMCQRETVKWLSLSEKLEIVNLRKEEKKKKKTYTEVANNYGKNESSL